MATGQGSSKSRTTQKKPEATEGLQLNLSSKMRKLTANVRVEGKNRVASSANKLRFADETTPKGEYPISRFSFSKNGVTLVSAAEFATGETLAFFEALDSDMCNLLGDSRTNITLIYAIVELGGKRYFEFTGTHCYKWNGKAFELADATDDEHEVQE